MMFSTMFRPFAVWVGMLCISLPILAQEFCATNSAELQAALSAAAASGQNSSIRVAAGNYAVPAGGFVYHFGHALAAVPGGVAVGYPLRGCQLLSFPPSEPGPRWGQVRIYGTQDGVFSDRFDK